MFSPATPPSECSDTVLDTACTVLRAQAQALTHISDALCTNSHTQTEFLRSLQYMYNALLTGSKIVITGTGKSLKIASKLVATMNSLGINAQTLHPSDALHGDLGMIRPSDVLLMISSSGKTAELFTVLNYLPPTQIKVCLTCTPDSPLAKASTSLLEAQVPDSLMEKSIYQIPAPTVTTTACLAVGDAVCICLAEMLVSDAKMRKANFGKWHPGGAIGQDYQTEKSVSVTITTPWEKIVSLDFQTCSELDLLRACLSCEWILDSSKDRLISTKQITKILQNSTDIHSALHEIGVLEEDVYGLAQIPVLSHKTLHKPAERRGLYLIMDSSSPIGLSDLRCTG